MAPNAGLEVTGSPHEGRQEDTPRGLDVHDGATAEGRQDSFIRDYPAEGRSRRTEGEFQGRLGPNSWGFQAEGQRSEGPGFEERRYQGTPFSQRDPRMIEGQSFRDSAYCTASADRPAVPEETLTPEEVQKILDQTKYETAPNTVKTERKRRQLRRKSCLQLLRRRRLLENEDGWILMTLAALVKTKYLLRRRLQQEGTFVTSCEWTKEHSHCYQ